MIGLGLSMAQNPRSGVRGGGTPVDPLAGVAFSLRLQAHNDGNVPANLFKDILCTDPATEDEDLIAAWKCPVSGLTYIQAIEANRPALKIVGGVPVVRFNGINSKLELLTAWDISSALTVVSCRVNDATDYSIFTNGTTADSFWRFAAANNGYLGLFRSSRINDYPAAMPVDGSHIFSVSSGADYEVFQDGVSKGVQSGAFSSVSALSQIGANDGAAGIPFGGDITAIWIVEDLSKRLLLEENIPVTP